MQLLFALIRSFSFNCSVVPPVHLSPSLITTACCSTWSQTPMTAILLDLFASSRSFRCLALSRWASDAVAVAARFTALNIRCLVHHLYSYERLFGTTGLFVRYS